MSKINYNGGFYALLLLCALILWLCLSSCNCERRIDRLSKKCGRDWASDTIVLFDTFKIKDSKTDTIFKYFQRDTVIIREGRLTMKYYYNNHDSTVYLSGKCDTIFVPRIIKVPYEKVEVDYNWWNKLGWVWWILGLAVLILVALRAWKFFVSGA